jgi:hypothetical protein
MKEIKRAAFYFVAHADDWQLFMTPEISRDIADKECKLIIVHTTAGDAGKDEKYWRAREKAAIDSLLFRISVDGQVHQQEHHIELGNNSIYMMTANNCSCYFLRLPDGAYDGAGFKSYHHQSLENFHAGITNVLCSVDTQSQYHNWNELSDVIDAIIIRELQSGSADEINDVCLNFPEPDKVLNPYDHNDHYNTTRLVQSTKAWQKYKKRAFIDYHILHSGDLVPNEELFWKIGMFCIYHQSLFREYGHSTIMEDTSFIPWCFRRSSYRDL